MAITKKYMSNNEVCKVTFELPADTDAKHSIGVAGDWNNWHAEETPMVRLKSGKWKVEIRLPAGEEYQFRYVIDRERWHTDLDADRIEGNPYGEKNAVIVT